MDSQNFFIGRQAVYDYNEEIFGFELLYRQGPENCARIDDGSLASSRVMLSAFLEIGLDRLTGNHRAFVNITEDMILDAVQLGLAPRNVVFEILEDVDVTQDIVNAVASLHDCGCCFAIDDYIVDPRWDKLFPYVDIVKFNIPELDLDQIEKYIKKFKNLNVSLLAEKVETREEFEFLKQVGFDLFQGYYLGVPKIISEKQLPGHAVDALRLLADVNDPDAEFTDIAKTISRDPVLSFKLMRYINSAAYGRRRTVDSIQQALVILGFSRLRAIVTMLVIYRSEGVKNIDLQKILLRAFACQALIHDEPAKAFTVGLLSGLDTLIKRPLTDLLEQLPLSADLRRSILDFEGRHGKALRCVIAMEELNWDEIEYGSTSSEQLRNIYLDASQAAFESLNQLESLSNA